MLALVLQLSLAQLLPSTPPPEADPARSWEPPPEPAPAKTAPKDAVTPPAPEAEPPNPEAPPPGYMQQQRPKGPSRLMRGAASSGAGVLGGVAAWGIASGIALMRESNTNSSGTPLDLTFATFGLASVMIAGIGFTVQHAMGGQGEVLFALLGSVAMMACAVLVARAIDPTSVDVAGLTTAIGVVPASVLSAVFLEVSTPDKSSGIAVSAGPGSLLVRF